MKTPCEIVVWFVLPTIRREIAKELVESYGMKQSEVGEFFGVTDAAISQYLKKKRGSCSIIEDSEYYPMFLKEIKDSARYIYGGTSDISVEMCRLCKFIKNVGLLATIYSTRTGKEAPQCAWGESPVTQIKSE